MSTIKFKTIRFKNFLSVGNAWMEYQLDQLGASGIVGSNGAGKSLLLDALCFSLYGKSYRKCNKPNLINSVNERESVVEIEFTTMNRSYKIIRGQKPSIFEIYQDGVLLNQDAKAKDYQLYLENNILKMNFKSFTQIIVLGASNYVPFMELSAADRRDVIEDLLDIQIFSSMREVLKEYQKDNNHHLAEYSSKMSMIQQKIDIQRNHIKKIAEVKKQNSEEKQKELYKANQTIKDLENEIDNLQEEIHQKLDQITDQQSIKEDISKCNMLESQFKFEIEQVEEVRSFYSENTICPTCKQEIDQESVKDLLEENLKRKNEIDEVRVMLQEKLNEHQKRLDEINKVHSEITKIHSLIGERKGRIKGLTSLIANIENDIQRLNSQSEDDSEYVQKLDEYKEEYTKLDIEQSGLNEYKKILKAAEVILKDNGIKSKIIKEYLPKMNALINKYLQAMDFFIDFNLDENFKERVRSRYRDDFAYESFSEGQKLRINIAILFAWRDIAKLKNSAHTNILVLDEVFDSSLDDEGIADLTKLLRTVTDEHVHVIVISHRGDTLTQKFDRVYNISMDKGFTTMTITE